MSEYSDKLRSLSFQPTPKPFKTTYTPHTTTTEYPNHQDVVVRPKVLRVQSSIYKD